MTVPRSMRHRRSPDLIGIRDRRYLNHTGTQTAPLHRRSDALRSTGARGGCRFVVGRLPSGVVPDGPKCRPSSARYTDEALYALAHYLYALQPPANPNHTDAQSRAGGVRLRTRGLRRLPHRSAVHQQQADAGRRIRGSRNGATVADVVPVRVGTDPELAMRSRRGTGYYKVPSLKGVWYRGPFGHSGTSPTLEDWWTRAIDRRSNAQARTGARVWPPPQTPRQERTDRFFENALATSPRTAPIQRCFTSLQS